MAEKRTGKLIAEVWAWKAKARILWRDLRNLLKTCQWMEHDNEKDISLSKWIAM